MPHALIIEEIRKRNREKYVDELISVGDYILTGGEASLIPIIFLLVIRIVFFSIYQ